MRFREIMEQIGQIRKDTGKAIPNTSEWPELNQSNNAYKQYRFGIACARAPDSQDMELSTSTHLNLVTIGYTKGDEAILDAAAKVVGVAPHRLSNERSQETDEINRTSTTAPKKKNKYGV